MNPFALVLGAGLATSVHAEVPGLRDPVLYPPEVSATDEVRAGELRVVSDDPDAATRGMLVLEHTSVVAEVHAGLARVTLSQWFHNPYEEPISAEYLFPLPSDAAVDTLVLRCGDRSIEGVVMEKQAARRAYEQAREDGKKAALLEQQRENLFRQHVSNLCPGEEVEVTLQYVQQLDYRDGEYRLDVPFSVGPRYSPPWVADAAALDTPYVREGQDFDLTVHIEEGVPVAGLWSETHDIVVPAEGTWGAEVRVDPGDDVPNRDFALHWTLAGSEPLAMAVAHRPHAEEEGYISLSVEPPVLDDSFQARPRELLFVIDESCSMSGEPYAVARGTVEKALEEMRPDDTFNLVTFASEARSLFDRPQPVNARTRQQARAWLDHFSGGGTEMQTGIIHSLTMPGDPERMRLVLMLTDGFIGGETHMFSTVRRHLGDNARLFALGVGSSPNRFLLEGLAEMGRGDVIYHAWGSPVSTAVEGFYGRIAHPAMSDIQIDWGGLEITEQYPAKIPDVWAGEPVRVVARYKAGQESAGGVLHTNITVSGRVGRDIVDIEAAVEAPVDADPAHAGVASLWARRKIRDIEWYPKDRTPAEVREAVLDVALSHHLVSTYTSLVAIDDRPSGCGSAAASVTVPQLAPAGLDLQAAGGELAGGIGGLIGAKGAQVGSGGLGMRGTGMGGGGSAMGLAGIGTKGRGSGKGGYGTGGGHLASKRVGSIANIQGAPIILGALDRSLVETVIRRNVNKIRYCYERELQKHPNLQGKVVMRFAIAPDGSVSTASVKESSLGSEAVEQCMKKQLLRMTFPQPEGAGTVIITYPFLFKAAE